MYVAADGNDSTAVVYTQGNHPSWATPFNPGVIKPYATITAAYAQARWATPDWVLIKRGDTLYQIVPAQLKVGRSVTEPSLLGAYGSGSSPILKVGTGGGLSLQLASPSSPWTFRNAAISGITFYAHTRNPEDPAYTGTTGGSGIGFITAEAGNKIKGILIEGCKFMFFGNNTIQGAGAESIDDITIRRTLFLSNYSGSGHSQGLYTENLIGLVLEENIFDHNGWYSVSGSGGIGQGTIYNHNTYMADTKNFTSKNNIFMRPSNMQNKFTSPTLTENITIENNLYVDGHIGISIETNYLAVDDRNKNISINNNVMTNLGRTNVTGQGIAWYLEIAGWDGGNVSNNLFMNQPLTTIDYSFGIRFWDNNENVDVVGNIFNDIRKGDLLNLGAVVENITFHNNTFQLNSGGSNIVNAAGALTGYSFIGNKYYTPDSNKYYFGGSGKSFSAWQAATGDNSTFEQSTFPDPTRSIETYMASIGETATLEAFYAKCRAMDRYKWDERFTADAINKWIKGGFDHVADIIPSPAKVKADIVK